MNQTQPCPVVQKYGGSSLSTIDKVRTVARKIIRSADGGQPVVVVVSAMGRTTSELLARAQALATAPKRRELDVLLSCGERMSTALLAMAIEEFGRQAVSLSGPQSGILTDEQHTDATILDVCPDRVSHELASGKIVIVAGYQGLSRAGEVTTLGRGGSDTTAVALAGALGARHCEIYSDVSGVYTADPRIVEQPMHLKQVDARTMTEYARRGARVLHPACIEMAHRQGVAVHALATFGDGAYTIITGDADLEYSDQLACPPAIVGVTSRKRRLRLLERPGRRAPERALERLGCDDVLRADANRRRDCLLDIGDMPDAEDFTARLTERLHGVAAVTGDLASVSIVASAPFAAEMRDQVESVLRDAGTSVASTYCRPLSVTCAIDSASRETAVRALHESLIEEPTVIGA